MNNDKLWIIIYSASFLVTLTLVIVSNFKNWYILFIYAGLSFSLIDHIKRLRQNSLAKGQTKLPN